MLFKSKKIVNYVSIFSISILIQACGGSSPDVQSNTQSSDETQQKEKMSDIEELLGIENTESQKNKPEEKNDDILTLLGAGEKPKDVNSNNSTAGQSNDNYGNLQEQQTQKPVAVAAVPIKKETPSKDVEQELKSKDAEIQRLKNELLNKEATIQRLESAPSSSGGGTVIAGTISDAEYEDLYQQGLAQFNNRNYKDAVVVFERLLSANDNHSLSDNAQYWIGESHYMQRKYKTAILDFEKVFSYSKANKKDHAQFKLGKCYEKLGDKNRAREEYQRFLTLYPKSDLRSKAENALSKL